MINNTCRLKVLEGRHLHQAAEGRHLHQAAEGRLHHQAAEGRLHHQAAEGRHLHQAVEDQPLPAPAVVHQEQEALEDVDAGAGEAAQHPVHQ